jgi:hypothetical protein
MGPWWKKTALFWLIHEKMVRGTKKDVAVDAVNYIERDCSRERV